jgi:hypothetical protein
MIRIILRAFFHSSGTTIMFSPRLVAFLAAIAFPASAFAQMWQTSPDAVRVNVNINIQRQAVASQNTEDQTKAMEAARGAIYDSLKAECGMLSAAFDADCRLVNINANSSMSERGFGGPMNSTNANASFELTPRHPKAQPQPQK